MFLTLSSNGNPRTWKSTNSSNLQFFPLPYKIKTQPSIIIRKAYNNGDDNSAEPAVGRIKRMVLSQEGRTKLNILPDREFYAYPRFVTHVDDRFISNLTNLYRASKNPRLDYFFVKDLNKDQKLEFENCNFDAVLCTVSVQYLQQPEKVFAEVFRILRPGGIFIVSFSNRLFYEKAISAWRDGTGYGRVQLAVQYFQCVEGFTQTEVIRKLPTDDDQENKSPVNRIMQFIGLLSASSDPFYAVIAYRNFKPVHE
ncbi:unnamed protein product [Withania somnifera]